MAQMSDTAQETHDKLMMLKNYLQSLGSAAVAFSGGVDSTFLLKISQEVLGDNVIAVTAKPHSFPDRELEETKAFCREMGISQYIYELNELEIEGFCENPPNRCYLCKKELLGKMIEIAREHDIPHIVEGSNMDDSGDYRPGQIAVSELGIKSPLCEAGLYKEEIRMLSKEMGLQVWDKPSFACLSSRFAYGERITAEKLAMVERAEQLLFDKGFRQARVRIHGTMARIEVLPEQFEMMFERDTREEIVSKLKADGFTYVSMDLEGYRTGSMNEAIKTKPPKAWGAVPSEGQLYYHKQEMAAFVHYGINSFTNQEWGSGDYTTDLFDIRKPDGTGGGTVDADQWVSILKCAGFKRLILVAKHHDGFCFWPTSTTAHNVSNAPSSDDIVLKVSAACRNQDMDMGIYLSPWDMKADKEGNFGAVYTEAEAGDNRQLIGKPDIDKYNNYYMTQLKELLGNPDYGGKDNRFVEVWMDGAKGWGKAQDYYFTDYHKDYWVEKYGLSYDANRTSWRNVIYSPYNGHYNENMVILAPYGDMVRWIGNENGTAGVPCWSKVNRADQRDKFLRDNGEDIHLQNHGDPEGIDWSVPETNTPIYEGGKWFYAENEDGTPKWEPKSIRELARVYFNSVGRGTVLLLNASPGTDGKIDKAQAARFKQFGEDIRETFKINLAQNSNVEAGSTRGNDIAYNPQNVLDGNYDTYWTMDDGETAGTLTVNFDGEKIFDIVSIQEYIPLGQRISKYNVEAYYNGDWHVFGNESECLTIGYKALVRGDITKASKIRINIKASLAVPVINMVGVYKAVPDFELKERTDTACEVNSGKPVFSFEAASYDVSKDDADIAIKIRRDGDIRCEAAVRFTTSPGSAVHGEVYETTDRNITFKAGETEKTVTIKLYGILKGERKKYFHVKLSIQDEDAALFGEYSEAVITVIDSGAN